MQKETPKRAEAVLRPNLGKRSRRLRCVPKAGPPPSSCKCLSHRSFPRESSPRTFSGGLLPGGRDSARRRCHQTRVASAILVSQADEQGVSPQIRDGTVNCRMARSRTKTHSSALPGSGDSQSPRPAASGPPPDAWPGRAGYGERR